MLSQDNGGHHEVKESNLTSPPVTPDKVNPASEEDLTTRILQKRGNENGFIRFINGNTLNSAVDNLQ